MLIALGGLPGVGKSALAMSLAQRIGEVHIRIDTIEQAMRDAGFTVSGPEGYLAARDLAQVIDTVGRRLEDAVSQAEASIRAARDVSSG